MPIRHVRRALKYAKSGKKGISRLYTFLKDHQSSKERIADIRLGSKIGQADAARKNHMVLQFLREFRSNKAPRHQAERTMPASLARSMGQVGQRRSVAEELKESRKKYGSKITRQRLARVAQEYRSGSHKYLKPYMD